MIFAPKLYLDLARKLIYCSKTVAEEEVYFRSSVNLVYYSIFLIARSLIKDRGMTIPINRSVHRFVINYYRNSANKTERKIGNSLNFLFKERKKADYDNSETVDRDRAINAYKQAIKT